MYKHIHTYRVAQKSSDTRCLTCCFQCLETFCSLCVCFRCQAFFFSHCIRFQCQETFAHPVYVSTVKRFLLTLYMLPVSIDLCSLCICFQCKEMFLTLYVSTVKRLLLTLYILPLSRDFSHLYKFPVSKDFCSPCICCHCQEIFLTLYKFPLSGDFCSPCICFQCQKTFAHHIWCGMLHAVTTCNTGWSHNQRWRPLKLKNTIKYSCFNTNKDKLWSSHSKFNLSVYRTLYCSSNYYERTNHKEKKRLTPWRTCRHRLKTPGTRRALRPSAALCRTLRISQKTVGGWSSPRSFLSAPYSSAPTPHSEPWTSPGLTSAHHRTSAVDRSAPGDVTVGKFSTTALLLGCYAT